MKTVLLPSGAALVSLLCLMLAAGGEVSPPPPTGPATEKRFPPLQTPKDVQATLFACDPLIEYPSAIAAGPWPGSLFVAIDYMTGLGTEIIRRDEVRLIEDADGDGYADRATVYAAGFNSIEGMTYHDGAVYVMHAPLLTSLRDTGGDGKADLRRDLLTGLGLPPEQNPVRLHCANGCVMGHDGWLYLALGDHGCDVRRPEGDRLVLEGGGILRCRADGRDLHVFASGLRNIYDVALDEELNVFVRDNENDGGDYKVRVCHSFHGADHGYPYLYYERPDEALPPLADLGLGSSAGGLCYLEPGLPAEYRRNLFFCEWGRAVMRYKPERAGGSFAPLKEVLFAAGAENDPYGFKPTDLAVTSDGALFIADWADGQRPKRGRGRIYRITAAGGGSLPGKTAPKTAAAAKPADGDIAGWLARLEAPSYYARCEAQGALERLGGKSVDTLRASLAKGDIKLPGRLHAVWILARVGGAEALSDLLQLARADREPRVRAQAVRAIADLADPTLARHKLDAGAGDAAPAKQLASLADGQSPQVLLEIIVALGRLRWPDAPDWLRETMKTKNALLAKDPAIAHAAMQTLRRSGNWPSVLKLLDEVDDAPLRRVALRALADRAELAIVDGLIDRLSREPTAERRRQYADALTRIYKRPAPWTYWGYRPAPRSPGSVAWARTESIGRALDTALVDRDAATRLAVLRRMQREKIPASLKTLRGWLREERDAERVAVLLASLGEHSAADVREDLAQVVLARTHAQVHRLAALASLVGGLDAGSQSRLLELAGRLEDGPVLAAALKALAGRPQLQAGPLLLGKLDSPVAAVRAAAVEAAAALGVAAAAEKIVQLLDDKEPPVRLAAATAAGKLAARPAAEPLLKLCRDADPAVRRASLDALRVLSEPRALPLAVAALADHDVRLPALRCIADLGGPPQAKAVAELAARDPSADVLLSAADMLAKWSGDDKFSSTDRRTCRQALAATQGASGSLLAWTVAGPMKPTAAAERTKRWATVATHDDNGDAPKAAGQPQVRAVLAASGDGRIPLSTAQPVLAGAVWLARADIEMAEATPVQFSGGGSGAWIVRIAGREVYRRDKPGDFQPDAQRFETTLAKGTHRVLVEVTVASSGTAGTVAKPEFQLRFRRQSSSADRERLAQAALTRPGDAARGQRVFADVEKSQCLKCHVLSGRGERIGPELTGIGSRFSRMHVIESVLEPSRAVAPGFQAIALLLDDGRTLTGLVLSERDGTLTLADNQGKRHAVPTASIERRQPQPLSTMPDGLEKRLTADEFIDLVAFLAAQKK